MSRASGPKSTQRQLPPCRLLVVDDGESNRQLVRLVMQRAGATVDEAGDGLEALEQVRQHRFDLIFMDVQMPNMDGTTAVTHMRQAGVTIPVIAMTAHAMSEQVAVIQDSGFSHVLTKPVDIDKLLGLTAELLGVDTSVQDSVSAVPMALEAPAAAPATAVPVVVPPRKPIDALQSTLPVDDEDFRAIAQEFAERFRARVQQMALLWVENNWESLARDAHWLKGAGGTAGFHVLTELGRELETAAKSHDGTACEQLIAQLNEHAGRIWVPPAAEPAPTIASSD